MIRLIEYFINHPRVTNMIVALIFITGLASAFSLRREQFPGISVDVIKITTQYPGAAPRDVEINVTNKIEDQLMDVDNIKKLTSMSMELNALRDDKVGDHLSREKGLHNAPSKDDTFFKVPKVKD